MTDDFESGKKYRNSHSNKTYKCIYVSPNGNVVLKDEETGWELFAKRRNRDFFVEIIPEVMSVGYFRLDCNGYVCDVSFVRDGKILLPNTHSVTFTNKGGEITAKIEKL